MKYYVLVVAEYVVVVVVGVTDDDWVEKDEEDVAEIPENNDDEEGAVEVADDGEEEEGDAACVNVVHWVVSLKTEVEVKSSSLDYRESVVVVVEVACQSCFEQDGGVDVGEEEEVFVEHDAVGGAVLAVDVVAALSSLRAAEDERFLGVLHFAVDDE